MRSTLVIDVNDDNHQAPAPSLSIGSGAQIISAVAAQVLAVSARAVGGDSSSKRRAVASRESAPGSGAPTPTPEYDDDDVPLVPCTPLPGSPQPISPGAAAARLGTTLRLVCDNLTVHGTQWGWSRAATVPSLYSMVGVFESGLLHALVSSSPVVASNAARALAGLACIDEGSSMLNQFPLLSAPYQASIGYVAAEYTGIVDATVYENVFFGVSMRISTAYAARRIHAVLELLNLTDVADERVGNLSAFQARLVQLATELVLDPLVLIVEDPTRDLSCFDHTSFVGVLRRIAVERNKIVIVSLSSLPWSVYDVIDGLVLLNGEGRTLFSGSRSDCEQFLATTVEAQRAASHGGGNFYGHSRRVGVAGASGLDGVGGEDEPFTKGDIGGSQTLDLLHLWEAEGETRHVGNRFFSSRYHSALRFQLKAHQEAVVSGAFSRQRPTQLPPTSLIAQLYSLMAYSVRRTILRPTFILAWAALALFFFTCIALGDRQSGDQNGMQNKRGIIFFLLSCMMHVNTLFVDHEVQDRTVFLTLRERRYFSTPVFFFVTVFRLAIPTLLFSLVAAVFTHFAFTYASALVFLLGLTSFTHNVFLLLLVFLFRTVRLVTLLLLVHYAYSVVFCGFLISASSVPNMVAQLSMLRPGYGGAVASQLRGLPYSCDQASALMRNATSYCYTGDEYLALQGFTRDTTASDAVELVVNAAVLLLMLFAAMRWSVHS